MKKNIIETSTFIRLNLLLAVLIFFVSCNKKLPEATPIDYTPVNNSNTSIGEMISTDTSYSFFAAAAAKTGQLAALSQDSTVFTVFLPTNDAFRHSGIPSVDVVNSLPAQTLGGIVGYAIIPGQQYLSTDFANATPNKQLPTSITIGAIPGTPLPVKLSTFPSISSTGFYDNNIPVTKADIKLKNGVIHEMAAIVAPPSMVLKDAIDNNPDLNYFKAAIARADIGQTGLKRFDSLLNYPVTNMTVLAPNDKAFQTLIFGLVFQNYLSNFPSPTATDTANAVAKANGAVAAGPAFLSTNNVSTSTVRGIIAYDFLATYNPIDTAYEPNIRMFSNNFTANPGVFYTTLVNNSAPPSLQPGIMAQATFSGPFVIGLKFTGLGPLAPGVAPYTGMAANATVSPITHLVIDNHAVNGVYFVIDKVLLPQ